MDQTNHRGTPTMTPKVYQPAQKVYQPALDQADKYKDLNALS
jgi:hypothetical protein